MISPTTIDQVRELSIVDVVGKFVTLKKSGVNYSALSPFSNEKHASFYVVPSKQIFKCFSSGKGGDGITFVMEKEGISYVDAVKALCSMFNIDIQYESNGQHTQEHYDEVELLYKINQATANLYATELLSLQGTDSNLKQGIEPVQHPAIKELIDKRRFTPDTILQWKIGYAPGEVNGEYTPHKWNFLAKTMIAKGYYAQGIDLGLIKTKGDVNYDTLRHRITFPIQDENGRYIGFGGRALAADQYNAKYLNSAESKVFNKSKVLFGLNFAGHAIRKRGYANLMEGYTDVISFHQAGQINTVGTCGTALTEDQCKLLRKYTNKAILINDPDEAGQNAAARNVDMLMKCGFQLSVLPMPSIVELKSQAFREMVFIRHRTKESLSCKLGKNEMEFALAEVENIVKVDPDELVRMY